MRYCPYFCEENVWHLCQDDAVRDDAPLVVVPLEERRVVFVSNDTKQVRMRHQRAGQGGVVIWDYHVVLLARGRVWDLDCTLGMPLDVDRWLTDSFVDADDAPGAARFRVVDAADFVRTFASDRSHMVESGHPFPSWPPIGEGMTLMRFVDFTDAFVGEIVDAATLRRLKR